MNDTTPPRVLVLTHPEGAAGGIAAFTNALIRELDTEVDVIAMRYRRLYPAATAPGREERHQLPSPPSTGAVVYRPWSWLHPLTEILRIRPALVVAQWWHPIFAPYLLMVAMISRLCGARFALVCHNATPHERVPLGRLLTRSVLSSADTVWTLSAHVAANVRELTRHPTVTTLSHPPNICLPHESDPVRASTSLARSGETARQLLFFGYVRPYKGLTDLIEALALTASTPAPTLTVAGPFYQPIDDVRRQVERLGLHDRVRLLDGYVPDDQVAALFADSELVVLPYRSASQSGVLTLAAEFRRPVVATDVGSIAADLHGHGVLTPPRDPAALARAIDTALVSPPQPPPPPENWTPWVRAISAAAHQPRRQHARHLVRRRNRLSRVAWAVVVACTAAVFVRAISTAHVHEWPTWRALAVATAALTAARVAHVTEWHMLVRGYGSHLRVRSSARILTSAELARFVPGGFWHFVAGFRLASRAGVSSPVIVATMCCDLAIRLAGAFAVFLLTAMAWPHLSTTGVAFGAVGLVATALVAHPRTIRFLAATLTQWRGQTASTTELPSTTLLATFTLGVVNAALRGTAAAAIVADTVPHIGISAEAVVAGAAALSWAVGVLVPFAPGGIGVQEASGAALIALVAPAAVAATTVVLLRVLVMGVETLTAGLAYVADANRGQFAHDPAQDSAQGSAVTAGPADLLPVHKHEMVSR